MNLKVLTVEDYWDGPFLGLALLDQEIVSYRRIDPDILAGSFDVSDKVNSPKEGPWDPLVSWEDLPEEIKNLFSRIEWQNNFSTQTENYNLEIDSGYLYFDYRTQYDLFRISQDELIFRQQRTKEFNEVIKTPFGASQELLESDNVKNYYEKYQNLKPIFPPHQFIKKVYYSELFPPKK